MAQGFNPPGLWGPNSERVFSQGVVQHQGQVIHVTGQVAWNAQFEIVGRDDVAAQMRQCLSNINHILAAAGGELTDIVSLTTYFTRREDIPTIQAVRQEYFKVPTAPTSNLIQIAGLVDPELLIELVPIAVVPPDRYRDPNT